MRDDLPEIVALGREKGFSYFQLNTNGLRLAAEAGYAEKLRRAGVSCAFLQFDGLDDSIYRVLRGRALLSLKLKAVENCAAAGLPVVLVPTVAPGVNDGALGDILRFGLERMPAVRGVHIQPISYFGRCALPEPERRLTIPRRPAGDRAPDGRADARYRLRRRRGGELLLLLPRQLPPPGRRLAEGPPPPTRGMLLRQERGRPRLRRRPLGRAGGRRRRDGFDEFLAEARASTFTVSGMVFQDAMNLDLERLRRCHICEADLEYGMVPFCAYNLTDTAGRALYRR